MRTLPLLTGGSRTAALAGGLALAAALLPSPAPAAGVKGYAGSEACRECHQEIYEQWQLTSHARMLRNALRTPSAVEADDFNPQIPFRKNDIYFTIGAHWVQKYLTLLGGQFYILPKYWNIAERKWEPYTVFNWREESYPLYCNGCHVVGFDPKTRSYVEEGIVCESCHGPGAKHVGTGDPKNITNPANLPKARRDMICEQCHTDGKDKATNTYPFPVGFKPGEDLQNFLTEFFMPKPKSKGWYWGDMSYNERHRMFMFYQTKFYATDRACEVCGFDRGVSVKEVRFLSRSEYCGGCHVQLYSRYKDHAFHTEAQAECVDCHVPTVTHDGQRYSIHDHRFDFSQPRPPCAECHGTEMLDGKGDSIKGKPEPPSHKLFNLNEVKLKKNLSLPEACIQCHKGKDVVWAKGGIYDVRERGFLTRERGRSRAAGPAPAPEKH